MGFWTVGFWTVGFWTVGFYPGFQPVMGCDVIVLAARRVVFKSDSNTYLFLNTDFCISVVGHVFDIWSVYEKYLQIQSNTYKITNKR